MIIASFNVNSIRARLPILEKWLSKNDIDVLALQETKVADDSFPIDDINALGYNVVFKGEKSYNGVAFLTKEKCKKVTYGFDGKGEDEGTRLIYINYEGLHIVNTYIPQGTAPDSEKFVYKLTWFDRLKKYFDEHFTPRSKLLWIGDYNVAPLPIDVHNPKRLLGSVGYHPKEHEVLEYVKSWGFVDIFREYNPNPNEYTFWDYRVRGGVDRGLGWRVDHICGTKSIANKSKNAWIDVEPRKWEKPSDHTPILVEIE